MTVGAETSDLHIVICVSRDPVAFGGEVTQEEAKVAARNVRDILMQLAERRWPEANIEARVTSEKPSSAKRTVAYDSDGCDVVEVADTIKRWQETMAPDGRFFDPECDTDAVARAWT